MYTYIYIYIYIYMPIYIYIEIYTHIYIYVCNNMNEYLQCARLVKHNILGEMKSQFFIGLLL